MLFGHQHNDVSQPAQEPTPATTPSLNPLAVDPTTGVSLPVVPETESTSDTAASAIIQPSSTLNPSPAAPPPPPPVPSSAPAVDETPEEVPAAPEPTPEPTPAPDTSLPPQPGADEPMMPFDDSLDQSDEPAPEVESQQPAAVEAPVTSDDLLSLKQEALAQLSPLVDKLDQTPEERFRTKMMMLQSTDNQALLKDAYQAAQQITDEKARAQALLDIINEINYFNSLNHHQ
jgi:hypothetical protein